MQNYLGLCMKSLGKAILFLNFIVDQAKLTIEIRLTHLLMIFVYKMIIITTMPHIKRSKVSFDG